MTKKTPDLPSSGGSYVREAGGKLSKAKSTAKATSVSNDDTSDPKSTGNKPSKGA
tara:strand:- start:2663 stop:2827 length:165 start_codon:yes stop_codon:yes gene_type:complete